MSHTLLSKSKSGQGRCSHTRGLTLPSRGRPTSSFACCRPPLTSNVSPHVQSSAIANHTACIGAAVLHRSSSAPSPAWAVRAAAATAAGCSLRESLRSRWSRAPTVVEVQAQVALQILFAVSALARFAPSSSWVCVRAARSRAFVAACLATRHAGIASHHWARPCLRFAPG